MRGDNHALEVDNTHRTVSRKLFDLKCETVIKGFICSEKISHNVDPFKIGYCCVNVVVNFLY
jgi:hypothetical protein